MKRQVDDDWWDKAAILHSRIFYEPGFLQLPGDRKDQQTASEPPPKPEEKP